MTGSLPYTGFYINLDRSAQRRREMEQQFQTYGLAGHYQRFPAIDGANIAPIGALTGGEIACFKSHYEALLKGQDSGLPVHILEDDILLSNYLGAVARKTIPTDLFSRYDIIFTDTFVYTNVKQLTSYKRMFDRAFARGRDSITFEVMDLAEFRMAGMTSYFVSAKAIDRVLEILRQEIEKGPTMPIDLCLREANENQLLNVGCFVPFVTTIRLEHVLASTILGREQAANPTVMLPALLRYSFFVDCDLHGYAKRFYAAMAGSSDRKPDAHRDFILELLEFVLSGRYQGF